MSPKYFKKMKSVALICFILIEENIEDCEFRAQDGDTYYTVSIKWMECIFMFFFRDQ